MNLLVCNFLHSPVTSSLFGPNASKEVGLEINVDKTKYMPLSRHQNAGQNRDIRVKIANRSFENASQFKYLGTIVTNQNLIQEEIKKRLKSDNVCYHSVQSLLSSHLLSKTLKIRIHKTIILPVVLYWCETGSLTLREEHGLRVFDYWVPRRSYTNHICIIFTTLLTIAGFWIMTTFTELFDTTRDYTILFTSTRIHTQ
jgi:hypothetical protein